MNFVIKKYRSEVQLGPQNVRISMTIYLKDDPTKV
jgi:hypothetical protein